VFEKEPGLIATALFPPAKAARWFLSHSHRCTHPSVRLRPAPGTPHKKRTSFRRLSGRTGTSMRHVCAPDVTRRRPTPRSISAAATHASATVYPPVNPHVPAAAHPPNEAVGVVSPCALQVPAMIISSEMHRLESSGVTEKKGSSPPQAQQETRRSQPCALKAARLACGRFGSDAPLPESDADWHRPGRRPMSLRIILQQETAQNLTSPGFLDCTLCTFEVITRWLYNPPAIKGVYNSHLSPYENKV
jgi:hypothetical protein